MNDEFATEDEADLSIFPPPVRTEPCQLYLISPQDVGGNFPDRLKAALAGGPVAAFQLRVKDVDSHELARLADPLQQLCADRDVAFIVKKRPTDEHNDHLQLEY